MNSLRIDGISEQILSNGIRKWYDCAGLIKRVDLVAIMIRYIREKLKKKKIENAPSARHWRRVSPLRGQSKRTHRSDRRVHVTFKVPV